MSKPAVSEASAQNVQAPQGGLMMATGAAAEFDLSAWIADQTFSATKLGHGRYISITAETADLYFAFCAATGAAIDETATQASAGSANPLIPEYLQAGQTRHYVIDPSFPFLRHKSAGVGRIRVFRS